jgi:hypothetical protein
MAPMRTGHDNERVSNERLNASRLRGQVEDLALTRDDDGLLVLRFHTCRRPGRVHRSDPPGFPAALEQISLHRDNKALVITGTSDSFMDQIDGPSLGEIFKPAAWEKPRGREGAAAAA